eukprot:TRINITY_DN1025_c0_g2_i13.p1 TRINITY_DN1025_c0_g2~~TRINITY_DN1025_c0_g2_i13.p1  ORF type:complete len:913 (-),score=162.11 TRINITY_DN1025_c0_g2_i13:637-3375(-)
MGALGLAKSSLVCSTWSRTGPAMWTRTQTSWRSGFSTYLLGRLQIKAYRCVETLVENELPFIDKDQPDHTDKGVPQVNRTPRVIVFMNAFKQLAIIPVPAFYFVGDVMSHMLEQDTNSKIFSLKYLEFLWSSASPDVTLSAVNSRVEIFPKLLKKALEQQGEEAPDAPKLAPRSSLTQVQSLEIRRLLFMLQYESVAAIREKRSERASLHKVAVVSYKQELHPTLPAEFLKTFIALLQYSAKRTWNAPNFVVDSSHKQGLAKALDTRAYKNLLHLLYACSTPPRTTVHTPGGFFTNELKKTSPIITTRDISKLFKKFKDAEFAKEITKIQAVETQLISWDTVRFRIENFAETLDSPGRPGFFEWLLVPYTKEGVGLLRNFEDSRYMDKLDNLKLDSLLIHPVEIVRIAADSVLCNVQEWEPAEGHYLLHKRHIDINFFKLQTELMAEGGEKSVADSCFVSLIKDPDHWRDVERLPEPAEEGPAIQWNPSQKEAFAHICGNAVTVVVGPPGTGKTKFMGEAAVELCLRAGEGYKVAVVGPTNAAVRELLADAGKSCSNCRVLFVKSGKMTRGMVQVTDMCTNTKEEKYPKELLTSVVNARTIVIGGTSWQLAKLTGQWADVLFVDEASLMRVAELCVPLKLLKAQGRLVVAGDPLQLFPIYKTAFPSIPDCLLSTSVMDCLLKWRGYRTSYASTSAVVLNMTYRLNKTLCRHAQWFYEPCNMSFTTASDCRIHCNEHSQLLCTEGANNDVPSMLLIKIDTAHSGPRSTAQNLEAACVQELQTVLDQCTITEGGQAHRAKWCVITPHRKQKLDVGQALRCAQSSLSYNDDDKVLVDTVECMQGQQRDVVVICMVVSDGVTVSQEAEFIFSPKRLNVAVTRARACCIIITCNEMPAAGCARVRARAAWLLLPQAL